jgi:predicted RNA-binding protein YlxR (DUF448 family)
VSLPRVKRTPQRTCVGCGQVQGKRELVRFVRTPDGTVACDPTGKRNGRGAYVHAEAECLERALAGRLAHALRCELPPGAAETLRQEFAALLELRARQRPPRVHRVAVPLKLEPKSRRGVARRTARP